MSKIALLSNESLIFLGLFHPETVSPPFLPDHVITPQLSSPQLVGLHLTHSHSPFHPSYRFVADALISHFPLQM